MSVWVSIDGNDPVAYESGYGDKDLRADWFDVAVSCVSNDRFRILVEDGNQSSSIVLDMAGLTELHRRIVVARDRAKK
jgi:hypothetical protein